MNANLKYTGTLLALSIVPAGVKSWSWAASAFPVNTGAVTVPVGVKLCVCVPIGSPVKLGVLIVPIGVPAVTASLVPLKLWLWSARTLPVNVGVLTVPDGVPALTASLDPPNV